MDKELQKQIDLYRTNHDALISSYVKMRQFVNKIVDQVNTLESRIERLEKK